MILVLLTLCIACKAQNNIKPIRVDMNDRKYMFFKFPSEIKYADMGSQDLTAEKSQGNVLKLKAEIPYFDKTNLSVVTTDGKYYSFIIVYNPNPSFIAVKMDAVKDTIKSTDIIRATRIEVSDLNTTHIILPAKVADIAVGHDELISEKAEDIDNIVKAKSVVGEGEEFFQTSLTVVTSDGGIYPMIVDYAKNPSQMSVSFAKDKNALLRGVGVNDETMRKMAKKIIWNGQVVNYLGKEDYKMAFMLYSVWTDQDVIAFYLHADNSSRIDYNIDFVKAYICDKKRAKKTAMQEEEITPIFTYYGDKDRVIHGKKGIDIVLFYKKFTIPQKRMLYFEMFEENGGRHIKFNTPNTEIIKAKVISKVN